jgi:RNA polymerase sigma-70 factor, ECF subfamily
MTDPGVPPQMESVQAHDLSPAAGPAVPQPLDFQRLFEDQFGYVWHTLRRLGVRDGDLEDLTHDVFLHVYRHRADYDGFRPLRPWLFGFAFRVAVGDRRRARNRLEVAATGPEPVDPGPTALDHLLQVERLELAHAALNELDLDRRAVFILHELDGHVIPEVARGLGIPLNTAYSRLRLAREQFAASLRRISRRQEQPK